MKKIFLIFVLATYLCACSSKLSNKAEKQMKQTVKELAKDPNVQISDVKIMFETDSVTIIHLVARGINGFGGYTRSEMEYIYGILEDGKVMERLSDLEKHISIYQISLNELEGNREFIAEHGENPTDEVAAFLKKIGIDKTKDSIHVFQDNGISELRHYGRIVRQ